MIHHLAEINPSIVFFILWGILSWLSKNREKKAKIENVKTNFSNVDSNINLDKQDDFEYEQDLFENNDEYNYEKEILKNKSAEISEDNIYIEKEDKSDLESIVNIDTVHDFKENKPNWLIKDLSNKKKIKKYLIFSEILKKPRSLNPY